MTSFYRGGGGLRPGQDALHPLPPAERPAGAAASLLGLAQEATGAVVAPESCSRLRHSSVGGTNLSRAVEEVGGTSRFGVDLGLVCILVGRFLPGDLGQSLATSLSLC